MDLFLAISQGIGLSLATGVRPFLPPLLVGALARADVGVDFERHATTSSSSRCRSWPLCWCSRRGSALLERSGVAVPDGRCWRWWRVRARRAAVRGLARGGGLLRTRLASCRRGLCALLGFAAARTFLGARARRGWPRAGTRTRHGFLLAVRRRRRARARGAGGPRSTGARISRSPSALWVLLDRNAAAPARSTRACASCAEDLKKLVLVMVDSLKPEMLERAVEEGRRRCFAEILRRGTSVAGLRERVPVGHAGRVRLDHDRRVAWTRTACPRSTGTTAASAATSSTARPGRPRARSACCARSTTSSTT